MPQSTSYTLPVSVPVSYGDAGLLQASPQMAHTSVSPRPSSSENDSGTFHQKEQRSALT